MGELLLFWANPRPPKLEFFFLSVRLESKIEMKSSDAKPMEAPMRIIGKVLLASITIFCLFSSRSFCQSKSVIFSPKLEVVGSSSFDFGNIYRGQKVTHLFTIKNAGSDTLLIKNVFASCGCTAAMTSTSVLPAQFKAELNVTFNSEGFSGQIHKTVTINSNDPMNPTQVVNITANVLEVLRPEPSYVFIQRAKLDSAASTEIQLKNVTNKPLNILSAEPKLSGLTVEVAKKNLKPGETTVLKGVYKPTKEGPAYGDIIVKTDFQAQPFVTIKLTANAYK